MVLRLKFHLFKFLNLLSVYMVGPQDGGFGFDQTKKYSSVENVDQICVQCQAGQHKNCLAKSKAQPICDCELCIINE